jgi:hypothetical protein
MEFFYLRGKMERFETDLIAVNELLASRGWAIIKSALIDERENKKENLTISNEADDEVLKGVCQGLKLAIDMPDMVKKDLKEKKEPK